MIRGALLHPTLLSHLAAAGHGAQILVCDANYPASTACAGPLVHLNLTRGTIDAVTIVRALTAAIPVEEATVMRPNTSGPHAMDRDPDIFAEFSSVIAASGGPADLVRIPRFDFYRAASRREVCLGVVSGETRLYANVLLRVGVLTPPPGEADTT